MQPIANCSMRETQKRRNAQNDLRQSIPSRMDDLISMSPYKTFDSCATRLMLSFALSTVDRRPSTIGRRRRPSSPSSQSFLLKKKVGGDLSFYFFYLSYNRRRERTVGKKEGKKISRLVGNGVGGVGVGSALARCVTNERLSFFVSLSLLFFFI